MPTLAQLRSRHPEHQEKADYWQLICDMVAGGDRMNKRQKAKLLANPDGRPKDVMDERIKISTYNNKMGPVMTRFNSELFAEPAKYTGSKDAFWEKEFFTKGAILTENNGNRSSFHSLLMSAMFQAITTGKAIAQVDSAIADPTTSSLYQQAELKELDPYVVMHPRDNLWDWETNGDLIIFAKLHVMKFVKENWDGDRIPQHEFTIYDRTSDGIFVSKYQVTPADMKNLTDLDFDLEGLEDKDVVIKTLLEREPVFSHNGLQKFPLIVLTLPSSLRIGAQLFEPQKAYYNQTASLEWGLFTSGYAMPYVTGVDDEDDDPIKGTKWGDGYYLTLKSGQSLNWTERPGGTFGAQSNYRSEIKRDIYDVLQQIAMSAADGAAVIARSGASKFEDRRPEQILLETYGEFTRNFALPILEVAAIVHAESEIDWKVEGFSDFLGEGLIETITDYAGIKDADIPSPTFKREVNKRFAKICCNSLDIPGDKWAQIEQELDEAATPLATDAPTPPPTNIPVEPDIPVVADINKNVGVRARTR